MIHIDNYTNTQIHTYMIIHVYLRIVYIFTCVIVHWTIPLNIIESHLAFNMFNPKLGTNNK